MTRAVAVRHQPYLDLTTVVGQLRRTWGIATAWRAAIGGSESPAKARLNVELLHVAVTDLLLSADAKQPKLAPASIQTLARALESLTRTERAGIDIQITVGAAAPRAPEDDEPGLSAEMVEAIKREVLGIRD